jgi:type I restriction enzyme M protein
MNERITENIVRDQLKLLGYRDNTSIHIEEQKSKNPTIQKCLARASKTGGQGFGKPEFIIKSDENNSFVVIIECKADLKRHKSETLDHYKDFAVDGVLLYASHLSSEFNVIAVAVSGQNEHELKVSIFLHPQNAHEAKPLVDSQCQPIERLLRYDDLILLATYDRDVEHNQYLDLMDFSRDLHEYIRDYAKLSEAEKPLLVSGVLIALSLPYFRNGYASGQAQTLPNHLFSAITQQIEAADIPQAKKQNIIQPYSFITAYDSLAKINLQINESPLMRIVTDMNRHVYPFMTIHHNVDVIGQFYAEFLRYAGGDASLGIVLTPRHITELFTGIANLNINSVVLDSCAGTGGFLIASMIDMCRKAKSEEERWKIKDHGLVGIESQPKMFALAASNMILRGDGKANLYQGSCFEKNIVDSVRKLKPTVGMINPPYSQKGDGHHELNFVDQLLSCLEPGSVGIAIVPISCALETHPLKEVLLRKHTLDAVMSMPDDLFHGIGTNPCIMVWKAGVPHSTNPHHQTWFGYWKDDGFIKVKNKGRIDADGRWAGIMKTWLDAYHNRRVEPGKSVMRKVSEIDEWCAEAYMETDYSSITADDFVEEIKKYIAFKVTNSDHA